MNLADVLTVTLLVLALLTVFVALWLLTAGLSPQLAEDCATRLGTSPLACAAVGLATLLPAIAAGILLNRAAPNAAGRLTAVILFISTLLAALVGSTGIAVRIGRGLASATDGQAPWHQVRRGGVILALTFLIVIPLPLALIPGLGALVITLLRRRAEEVAPSA